MLAFVPILFRMDVDKFKLLGGDTCIDCHKGIVGFLCERVAILAFIYKGF